jgi:hypothetical protein
MTDNAQQGNNLSSSAQGAPKPTGDKPRGTEADKAAQQGTKTEAHSIQRDAATEEAVRTGKFGVTRSQLSDTDDTHSEGEKKRGDRRGAGSGDNATETRSRSLVEWPPEPLSHEEHVELLLEMAQENEDHNLAANREAIAANKTAQALIGLPQGDPINNVNERERVLKEYHDANDPALRRERLKGEMEARARRDNLQVQEMYGDEAGKEKRHVAVPK